MLIQELRTQRVEGPMEQLQPGVSAAGRPVFHFQASDDATPALSDIAATFLQVCISAGASARATAPRAACTRLAGKVPCPLPGRFSRAPLRCLPPAGGAFAGAAAPKHHGMLFHAANSRFRGNGFSKLSSSAELPWSRCPALMGHGAPLLRSPGAAVGWGH